MPNFPTHADAGAFASATDEFSQIGLTKREYFAAAAMQAIATRYAAQGVEGFRLTNHDLVSEAVQMADWLIEALNQ